MTCGCRIKVDHLNPENYFVAELLRCPLHEAAGEMLEALKHIAGYQRLLDEGYDMNKHDVEILCERARAAIAKAERRVTER